VFALFVLLTLAAGLAPAAAAGAGPLVAARPSMHVPEAVLINEGFENATFPPTGWATFNVDGGGTQWVRSTTTPHTGAASAYHQYSSAGAQDGWLITPQLTLLGGVSSLVFWQRDTYSVGSFYDYHGVLITTDADPNPATATYTELWEADIATTWTETTIDLSAYAGQQVYLAFRYTGDDADDWRIDDVVVNSEAPVATGDIDVSPLALANTQAPDTTAQLALAIGNTGEGDLAWTIGEQPGSPEAVVSFVLDDGAEENNIGIGGTAQFIFLNRFTPAASFYPIVLNEIQVYFATDGLAQVGDDMLLAIYENTTGNSDPAVGSNLLATLPVTVSALDAWNSFPLAAPVTFNGPGDVLLGVIALEVPGTNYWPAALDQTASQQRSWAGWWNTPTAPTPPTLPPDSNWTLIDAFFPGNWMIRGYGETNAPCADPADVPWLSVNPAAGTTAPAGSTPVDVTLDSTGLGAGIYLANLCVASDDPTPGPGNGTELVVVPVELTVEDSGPVPSVLEIPTLGPAGAALLGLALAGLGLGALRRRRG